MQIISTSNSDSGRNANATDGSSPSSAQDTPHTNGKSALDSSTTSNGTVVGCSTHPDLGRVKKQELIRLMLQSLGDLGYTEAAHALQQESGVVLESDMVTAFRQSIIAGNWADAEARLSLVPLVQDDQLLQCQFLIRQQKFLELLELGQTMEALHVLRSEVTPVCQNIERLHQLSSLMFCTSMQDVKAQIQWDGAKGTSRQQLLTDLQRYIAPSAMLPRQRLLTLINQAFEWQTHACLYHSSSAAEFSLFSDHICDKSLFPSQTHHILEGHTDEVWQIAFSNNGRYLASTSKDGTCIIWDMTTFEKLKVLKMPKEHATYCVWSPDDTKLLICGSDFAVRLWDPMRAELLATYNEYTEQVVTGMWLPDGEHFISGACDETLILRHIDGTVLQKCKGDRILDVRGTKDGRRVVATTFSQEIIVYDVEDLKLIQIGRVREQGPITSLELSADGLFALVNIQDPHELHLWNLKELRLVQKYTGHKQGHFIIRSVFGGVDQSFVVSGSEDNCVYVWSREHRTLLEVLEGHHSIVNCVSWCPTDPMMFASASDDKTIRIWGLPDRKQNVPVAPDTDASHQTHV